MRTANRRLVVVVVTYRVGHDHHSVEPAVEHGEVDELANARGQVFEMVLVEAQRPELHQVA